MAARLLPTALVCCALIAAGCGDDSGNGSAAAPADLTVKMSDYKFDPRDVTVAPGAVIRVTNEGEIAHNLKVERGPNPRQETQELTGTDSFLPGDSETLEVDLPRGRYAMVCTVPGHRELGMTGSFRVK